MAAEKLLTEASCKAAKAKAKLYYLNDGAGLRLRIRPDGSRTWIYRYRLGGKEMSSGLGAYPKVTLQIARAKIDEARQHVAKGDNPSTVNRVAKANQITKGEATFGAIAREWLAHNESEWSAHYYERNDGLLKRYLLPDLERMPIDSIKEAYLYTIIKASYDKGTKESARRARGIAAQIFSYARATHRGTINPARDMADNPYFKKPPVKHFSALPQNKVGDLINALNVTGTDQKLDAKTVCALRLALYTGLRDNSIRGALWGEIDFENATWTIPTTRMKSGREHQVPLPSQAISALLSIKPLTYRDSNSYIFPGRGKHKIMSENTLRLALHRLGFVVTAHGLRSLITDVLNENRFNPDAIERQLDHAEKNKIRRAYLRSNFMDERIKMMQWFADWCDAKATGNQMNANVTSLRAA
ncbi:tyrosine-type recombinase/integrase [Polynucleobacter sp. es-EL-1]|uniref:tyrosine-type recombinase/integrase n=1 Tax=Polynucleobacter sp. es-EL-1 TaxID=1855652 RepID=UPI001BFDDE04|nr:integrase arm-type DNA-binding domain-containing protein [Polynucleobacter sp. es-EL-1]QWE11185.1 tyrosine-type recombinase/integrase [Polynucleobacter sp. es-EL-1]